MAAKWASEFKQAIEKVQYEQAQKATTAGFAITVVSAEEFEDGVGTCAGVNAMKDGVWYTLREALNEIGERTDFRALAIERGYLK
jgi:hypothetical protein